jgi:enoyl-CoA hydratase/carnithine racemase
MGPAKANEMLLLGTTYTAQEWEKLGMITYVTLQFSPFCMSTYQVTNSTRKTFLFWFHFFFFFFLSRILPSNDFHSSVRAIALKASKFSPTALRKSKNLIVRELRPRLLEANKVEMDLVLERMKSAEFQQAVMKFMGKLIT